MQVLQTGGTRVRLRGDVPRFLNADDWCSGPLFPYSTQSFAYDPIAHLTASVGRRESVVAVRGKLLRADEAGIYTP
jgi:hypothetical protein